MNSSRLSPLVVCALVVAACGDEAPPVQAVSPSTTTTTQALATEASVWAGGTISANTQSRMCGPGGLTADSVVFQNGGCVCGEMNASRSQALSNFSQCTACASCTTTSASTSTPQPDPTVDVPEAGGGSWLDGRWFGDPSSTTLANLGTNGAWEVYFRDNSAAQKNATWGGTYAAPTTGASYGAANSVDVFVFDHSETDPDGLTGRTVKCVPDSALADGWQSSDATAAACADDARWNFDAAICSSYAKASVERPCAWSAGEVVCAEGETTCWKPLQTLTTGSSSGWKTDKNAAIANVRDSALRWNTFGGCTSACTSSATSFTASSAGVITSINDAAGKFPEPLFLIAETRSGGGVAVGTNFGTSGSAPRIAFVTTGTANFTNPAAFAGPACGGTSASLTSSSTCASKTINDGRCYALRAQKGCSASNSLGALGQLRCENISLNNSGCVVGGLLATGGLQTTLTLNGSCPSTIGVSVQSQTRVVGDVVGHGSVCFKNSTTIAGGVRSRADISLMQATVEGNVAAVGNLWLANNNVIDTVAVTPPTITISGVGEGAVVNVDVVPVVSVSNGTLTSLTLDGVAFASGSTVTAEGDHTLVATATGATTVSLTRHFTIDRTAPVITVNGVTDGSLRNTPADVSVSVTELHPGSVTAVLDGNAFTGTVNVAGEGAHSVVVTAVDAAGNSAATTVSFTIDTTAPVITVSGVSEGAVVNAAVDVAVSVVELHAGSVTSTVDGTAFAGSVNVAAEGDHVVVVTAVDGAGNSATRTVHFAIDVTAPVITIGGVSDGSVRNTPATVSVSVAELHPGSVVSVADGTAFSGSVVVSGEGAHSVVVTAVDAAGNSAARTVSFTIDTVLPSLSIVSPAEGSSTSEDDVVLVVSAADASGIATVTAGGEALGLDPDGKWRTTLDLAVGANAFVVSALDGAGNTRSVTLHITRTAVEADAGFADAGYADAGFADAGFADAGFADAGYADAGFADAGFEDDDDAGFADAGYSAVALSLTNPQPGLLTNAEVVVVAGSVSGGHAPVGVSVEGSAVTVVGGAFTTSLSLPEGDTVIDVVATDVDGATATATRTVTIDRTPPYVDVTAPAQNATLTASPVVVHGVVGDVHLAAVTVDGDEVLVLGGEFAVPFDLSPGTNTIYVRAIDGAGNVTLIARDVVFNPPAPMVEILDPIEGQELTSPTVTVHATVTPSYVANVTVNGAAAVFVDGVWEANVTLANGANTITVVATDPWAASVSDVVHVVYRNVANEALSVVVVDPARDAIDVEPDSVVSLVFNKPIAEQELVDKLMLRVDGTLLPIGTYTAPDGSSVSLIARAPLPEGATVEVEARDLDAKDGPDQAGVFLSRFRVRRPLTGVVGVVLDEDLIPVRNARVTIEGTSLTTTAGSDGHWGFFDVKAGIYRVVVEGPDGGEALTRIRPRIVVEGERTTRLTPHFLTVVDEASAVHVDGDHAVDARFFGKSAGLRIVANAGALQLRDGRTQGVLTATPLSPELSPFPIEGRIGAPLLWQVQPQGTRFTAPARFTFPNTKNLALGKRVIVYALDDVSAEVTARGLGTVTAEGVEADEGVAGVVDVVGYLPLSPEQETALLAALAGGTGSQGALLDDVLDVLTINKAHAQAVAASFMNIMGALNNLTSMAPVTGRVISASDDQLIIDSSPPSTSSSTLTYQAHASGASAVAWSLTGAPSNATITAAGRVSVVARGSQDATFDVVASGTGDPVPRARQTLHVIVTGSSIRTMVKDNVGSGEGDAIGMANVLVELGVSGLLTATGRTGGFGVAVPTYGGEINEIAIATMELGTFPVARFDALGELHVEQVKSRYYARSPILPLFKDFLTSTKIVVDAVTLAGDLTFVDGNGVPLPAATDGATTWDQTRLTRISAADVAMTEVHFFKASDLGRAIAHYASAAPGSPLAGAQGSFHQLRIGPRDLTKLERKRQGQTVDERVLKPGDRVVMFAINHATGYAGMTTVTVPSTNGQFAPAEVRGEIKLFPPEVELGVQRQGVSHGIADAMPQMLVRSGGAATTTDKSLVVSTTWRVRLQPNSVDDVNAPDAGVLVGETADAGSVDGGVPFTPTHDEGVAGAPLERACSELPRNATPREALDCLQRDDILVDVPSGVPPLAGRVLGLGTATVPTVFRIAPGARASTIDVARRFGTQRVLDRPAGQYLVHVVGRPLREADRDGDGTLNDEELLRRPPLLGAEGSTAMPATAFPIKAAYTARLRPEGGGAARAVLSYDRTREALFRLLSINNAGVVAVGRGGPERPMTQDDPTASAEPSDTAYTLSLALNDPGAGERAANRTDFEARIGNDDYGINCGFARNGSAVTANCDDEDLMQLISSLDVVYLSIMEGTNTANVLYRYDFYGLSTRVDHVSGTTLKSLQDSTTLSAAGKRKARAAHSKPNFAIFPVDRQLFANGGVIDVLSNDILIRSMDVVVSGATVSVQPRASDTWQGQVVRDTTVSEEQKVYFSMALPASVVSMLAPAAAPRVTVRLAPTNKPAQIVAIGRPRGRLESRAAMAVAHTTAGDVDVTDGHVSFVDVDMSAPDRGRPLTFARIYNNQNNEVSSIGIGWSHNHEAYIAQENVSEGRLSVVRAGTQLTFSGCTQVNVPCTSDKSKDQVLKLLTLPTAQSPDAELTAELTDHDSGEILRFETPSSFKRQEGLRRVLLTSIDDGLRTVASTPALIRYAYRSATEELTSVHRDEGVLSLQFEYAAIAPEPPLHSDITTAISVHELRRMSRVCLVVGTTAGCDGSVVDKIELAQDIGGTTSCSVQGAAHPGKRIGLLLDVCRPQRSPRPHWAYTYAPLSSGLTAPFVRVEGNEIVGRKLFVTDGGVEGVYEAWTYGRQSATAGAGAVPQHLRPAEIVGSTRGPGDVAATTLRFTTNNQREITRPDGVVHELTLNTYGGVAVEQRKKDGGPAHKADYENDSETEDAPGRVLPTFLTSTTGDQSSIGYDLLRHRVTSDRTAPGSTATSVPAGMNSDGTIETTQSDFDARFPVPKKRTFSGGGGAMTTATLQVSAFGSIRGSSIDLGSGASIGFSMNYDGQGRPTTGTNVIGETITFTGEDTLWKLPTKATVTHTGVDGGLATVERSFTYDDLGRLKSITESPTGRASSWVLDALGRETSRTETATPSPTRTTTTAFRFTGGQRTIEVTVGGSLKSRTTFDGALIKTVELPFAAGTLTNTYTYVAGVLDSIESSGPQTPLQKTQYLYAEKGKFLRAVEVTLAGAKSSMTNTLDANGNVTAVATSDERGRTTTTTLDKLGRAVRWDYGSNGTAVSNANPGADRDVVSVTRDTQGNVLSQSWGRHTVTLHRDRVGRVTSRTSEAVGVDGVVNDSFAFDDAGRPKATTLRPSGKQDEFFYDDVLGRLTKHKTTIQTIGPDGAAIALTTTEKRTYNDLVSPRTITIEEDTPFEIGDGPQTRTKKTVLSVDALDRIIKVKQDLPNGGTDTRTIGYDGDGLHETHTAHAESTLSFVTNVDYDAQGNLVAVSNDEDETQYVVDGRGVLRKKTTTHDDIVVTEEFDVFGDRSKATIGASRNMPESVTTWSHPSVATEEEKPPAAQADPAVASIVRVTNARGLLLSETHGSRVTKYEWDGTWPRIVTTTEGTSTTTVSTTYDDAGRARASNETWTRADRSYTYATTRTFTGRSAAQTTTTTTASNSETRRTQLTFDSLGGVAQWIGGVQGDTAAPFSRSATDPLGRPIFAVQSGQLPRRTDVEQGLVTAMRQGTEATLISYDAGGRVFEVTDPLGHRTTSYYSAAGYLSSRDIAGFVATHETYDAAGFLDTSSTGAQTTDYSFGPLGELTKIVLPSGDTWTYDYTVDRKLKLLTPPEGVKQAWFYDEPQRRLTKRSRGTSTWTTDYAGTLATIHSSGGLETKAIYDGRGRVAFVEYSGAPRGLASVENTYAADDQPLRITDTVRSPSSVQTTETTYTHDDAGRVRSIARPSETVGFAYSFASASSTQTRTLAGTPNQVRTFNGMGRPSSISGGPLGSVEIQYYESTGLLKSITGSGVNQQWNYRPSQQLDSIVATSGPSGSPTTISRSYSYDTRGNRTTETVDSGPNAGVTSYRYDNADRLIGVKYGDESADLYLLRGDGARAGIKKFAYYPGDLGAFNDEPPNGATLTNDQHYEFDEADGLKKIFDEVPFTSSTVTTDAEGRVTFMNGRTYEWDAADRLVSTTVGSATTRFGYDAQGWRVSIDGPSEHRRFIWGLDGLEAEGDVGGDLRAYTRGAGLVLGVGSEAFGHDALGSVVERVFVGGGSAGVFFDAFGANSGTAVGSGGDRVGYTGHRNDADGLVYAQARYLDPTTGRFLSLDPVAGSLSDPLSTQGFTYGNANPTRFVDPDGRTNQAAFKACQERRQTQEHDQLSRRIDQIDDDGRGRSPLPTVVRSTFRGECLGEAYDWKDALSDAVSGVVSAEEAYLRVTAGKAFAQYNAAGDFVERNVTEQTRIALTRVEEQGVNMRGGLASAAPDELQKGLDDVAEATGKGTRFVAEGEGTKVLTAAINPLLLLTRFRAGSRVATAWEQVALRATRQEVSRQGGQLGRYFRAGEGNILVADITVGGKGETLKAFSGVKGSVPGYADPAAKDIFELIPSGAIPTDQHTEIKVLAEVLKRIKNGEKITAVTLISERAVCRSCGPAISQFEAMTGIEVEVAAAGKVVVKK